ncbi:arrestin domain-containing protein 3-like [Plakobranchus ocellatus]|uniref:Arrestin domain-containing protein 3-like n=1 Tax=Plakobranchus ocellatus TaxID=259542 RepID=A0AAV3Y5E5_9GAST|nr:arrestin domain-containing protein 3-like [Plakobranchus ocellatus]
MDAKEIKAYLKAAREAIRTKDYKDAAKQCKAVLVEDPNNYNALVFLGVTAEGLDHVEQALKAYKKATDAQPDQLLAWQGISSMLEKHPGLMSIEESSEVIEKLVTLFTSDETKQLLQLHKLYDLYMKSSQNDKALQVIARLLHVEKEKEKRIKPLCSYISLMSPSAPHLVEEDLIKYKSTLEEVISAPEDLLPGKDYYANLLLSFVSQVRLDELYSTCEHLIQDHPTLASPLEFQLRLIIDSNIGEGYPSQATCDTVKRLTSALAAAQENNPMVKVGQAFTEIQNKNYNNAKDLLHDNPDDCICGWYLLGQTYLNLHSYLKCLEASQKGLDACSKDKKILCTPLSHVQSLFELARAEAYLEIGSEEAQSEALMILEEVQEKMPTEAFLIKAYIFIDQGKIADAQECVTYLPLEALPVQTLQAAILFEKKDFSGALKILQGVLKNDNSDARAALLLGMALWELRSSEDIVDAKQECFTALLKAAKLDPYNHKAFLYIGYFYKEIQQDAIKAKRCFQKAFDLQPENDDCGVALVDILLKLGEEEQSLRVLQKVTQMAPAGCAKWAWLRLGLHQMRHEDPSAAIVSLQSALRADPEDQHVWECLAEAYLHRGSLTASLKAFTKASELSPDSVYCLQQIASIKQVLGLTAEAIAEYKHVLEKSPAHVPALKGISESLIQLAKQNLNQCLDGLAQGCFEEAIEYITRAASQRSDMSCLWKLMGDACSLASFLDTDLYSVPTKLVGKRMQDQGEKDTASISKIELLQIGSRSYSQALKILPESGSLWHDLGVNLFYQSQTCHSTDRNLDNCLSLINKSSKVIKKAISFEPKEWKHWNALGVIASSKIFHKPALAQHCFIKSIECDSNNVTAWTNLGALYLDKGEVKLAHNAFTAAQSIDPTYIECWIGQALIAEMVGHEETMDLFRHTTELGFHVESAISYGQWVLSVLSDNSKKDSALFQYCIKQMAALPAASDALARYTTRVKSDGTALNMQGLLFEHQCLFLSSIAAFKKALTVLEIESDKQQELNTVRLNLSRVLCKQKKYAECVQQYEQCDLGTNLEHMCTFGLALLCSDRLEDSLRVYHNALNLAEDGPLKSQIYAVLGMAAFMRGDFSSAKSYLFDGFQSPQPSLNGLFALCSLGLLQKDITLATAVLDELYKRADATPKRKDTLFLEFYKYLLEGDHKAGKERLEEYLKTNPEDATVWSLLARITLSMSETEGAAVTEYATASIANSSFVAEMANQRMLQSLGQLSAGHHSTINSNGNALKNAQKAFHQNPGCISAQATLSCAVHAEARIQRALYGKSDLFKFEESLLHSFYLNESVSDSLHSWCLQHLVINSVLQDKIDVAENYLKQFQEDHHKFSGTEDFRKVMTQLLSSEPHSFITDMKAENGLHRLSFLIDNSLQQIEKGTEKAISLLSAAIESSTLHSEVNRVQVLLERIALKAAKGFMELENPSSESTFENTVKSLKENGMNSPIVSLLQALRTMKFTPDNKRLAKHYLATALDQVDTATELGYLSSILRQELVSILWDSKKETDQQMVKGLLEDAAAKQDHLTAVHYQKLLQGKH